MARTDTGAVVWTDLTVDDAEAVRDFYGAVVGWRHEPVDMGGTSDFSMQMPATGKTAAGICHARGVNAGLPPQWLICITVEDLDACLERCRSLGGDVIAGPKAMGEDCRYAVIRDPAGAIAALCEDRSRDA
jgi:hypothetical protein